MDRACGLLLAALLLWGAPLAVAAQGAPAPLEQLEVALWPEFDRPAMLVILRFRLAEQVSMPTTVELPIPVEVGQPFAVAWQDAGGDLFDAEFNLSPQGLVSVSIPQGVGGQLEYYADLTMQDQVRSFRYEWPGTVALGGLSYEVQQPVEATEFSVSPAPDSQGPGPFGLDYATAELGPQPAGSQLAIEVSYQKSGSRLSQPAQGEPLAPIPAVTPELPGQLPYLLAGGGVVLVAAGVIYYLRGRSRSRPAPRALRRPAPSSGPELEVSAVYCHQCGTKAKVNDSFCRNCGNRLRQK